MSEYGAHVTRTHTHIYIYIYTHTYHVTHTLCTASWSPPIDDNPTCALVSQSSLSFPFFSHADTWAAFDRSSLVHIYTHTHTQASHTTHPQKLQPPTNPPTFDKMFSKKFTALCALALCAAQASAKTLKVVDITSKVTTVPSPEPSPYPPWTNPITLKVR